jgi:hypothetical protein
MNETFFANEIETIGRKEKNWWRGSGDVDVDDDDGG